MSWFIAKSVSTSPHVQEDNDPFILKKIVEGDFMIQKHAYFDMKFWIKMQTGRSKSGYYKLNVSMLFLC